MPANVVIIGGGVVGFNAARIASGLGAQVQVFDIVDLLLNIYIHFLNILSLSQSY